MFAAFDLQLLPEQASEFARDYDKLFWYITVVIAGGGIAVYAGLAYFGFKYARKPGQKSIRLLGSNKVELIWTLVPALFFVSFFVWGTKLFFHGVSHPPADAPEVYVVGKQWMWKIQHPDGVREINELHLMKGQAIKITATSEDVIHDFGIPAFRNKIDVLPGRYVTTWYLPSKAGTYHIFCDQYCGQGHSQMVGKVHVMEKEDFEAWKDGMVRDRKGKNVPDGTPAWEGRKLFLKLQCITCHNNVYDADKDNPNTSNRAPNLEGLYKSKIPLQGGSTIEADESYIRESIRNPMAKVHDGWKPIMPAYPRAQVSEEELINLVAFIKSLKPGDLPRRTDEFTAPVGAPTTSSEGGPQK
jgi:cytochrome c oxidase subunit 2